MFTCWHGGRPASGWDWILYFVQKTPCDKDIELWRSAWDYRHVGVNDTSHGNRIGYQMINTDRKFNMDDTGENYTCEDYGTLWCDQNGQYGCVIRDKINHKVYHSNIIDFELIGK